MGAPQWRIQVTKHMGAEEWSNDYLTDLATLTEAHDFAVSLVQLEESIHMAAVHFDYYRVSSVLVGDRIFQHVPINANGGVANADFLPLFNTVRVDFQTASSDPARKYYRAPIAEGNQAGGVLSSDYINAVALALFTFLGDPELYGNIVTTAGNKVITGTVHDLVQMRQLHRHKRKKVVPPA